MKVYLQSLSQSAATAFNSTRFLHSSLAYSKLSPSLITYPQYNFKRVQKRVVNHDFKEELKQYQEKLSLMRKKHKKEYWVQHTQVENMYLEKWRKEKMEKQRRDLDRWRTAICNISMHTKNQMQKLEKKEARLMLTMRNHDLLDMRRSMQNKIMLDIMEIESKKWPTLLDLHQKVDENVILPQTILNYGEYQKKLQNLAFYAEQGDHEAMQKLLDKEDVMEKKNLFLQPLFRDLKSMIKHMTYTEESQLLKEYMQGRQMIIRNFPPESKKGTEGLEKLKREYAKLLQSYKKSLDDPTKKLKTLQKRLEDVFQLVSIWTQYVEVIYMPESEIHVLDTVSKMELRPEDTSYQARLEEKDVEARINILFGKEDEEAQVKESLSDKEGDIEAAYETVNEDLTSDTTEASGTARRGESQELSAAAKDSSQRGQEKEQEVEEGILSSDEEEKQSQKATVKVKDQKQEQLGKEEQVEEIKSFKGEGKVPKKGGLPEESKDQIETKFNFAEQDIEQYTAKLQNKAERSKDKFKSSKADDDQDNEDFIGGSSYSKAAIQQLDMQAINLFGAPLESQDQKGDQTGDKQTSQVLQDLIEMVDSLETNDLANLKIRKSFVYYDPYDPDESVANAFLKFEDTLKLRASLVLDYFKQEVNSLPEDRLTFADKERKQQVLKLIEQVGNLKIVDAQVLLKLYDLYRFKI